MIFDAPRAPASAIAARIQAAVSPSWSARPPPWSSVPGSWNGYSLMCRPTGQRRRHLRSQPGLCRFAHHGRPGARGPAVRLGHRVGQQQGPRHLLGDPPGRSDAQQDDAARADADLPAHHCSHPRTRPPALRAHGEALISSLVRHLNPAVMVGSPSVSAQGGQVARPGPDAHVLSSFGQRRETSCASRSGTGRRPGCPDHGSPRGSASLCQGFWRSTSRRRYGWPRNCRSEQGHPWGNFAPPETDGH